MVKSKGTAWRGRAVNGTVIYRNNVRPAIMFEDGEIWFDTRGKGERLAHAKTGSTFKPFTGKWELQ